MIRPAPGGTTRSSPEKRTGVSRRSARDRDRAAGRDPSEAVRGASAASTASARADAPSSRAPGAKFAVGEVGSGAASAGVGGRVAAESAAAGSGAVGSGAVGSGAVGSGAVGSGAVGSGAVGSGAAGSGAADSVPFEHAGEAQTRDELLSVAAHELRTPLTPITILLQAIERRARSGTIDIDAVVRIRQQVARLAQLITDLLDVSRSNEGRLEIEKRPVDLGGLVARCGDAFRSILPQRQIAIDMEDGLVVLGDEARLSHALACLFESAARCASRGDVIAITARRDGHGGVAVTIADGATGWSGPPRDRPANDEERPAEAPAEREAKVASSRTAERDGGGTRRTMNGRLQNVGLGVHIARAVARAHGGDVSASITPEGGARFLFALPAATLGRIG